MIGKSITPWRVVAIYLAVALVYFGDSVTAGVGISAADLIYTFGAYRYLAPSGFVPSNRELADQVTQFEPWRKFAREELAAGRFPWSNPYQGGGLPFVGNHQSALFYPTTWLFLVLPDNLASVLTALAKVTAAAAGTFVFLRSFAILRWVALLVLFS